MEFRFKTENGVNRIELFGRLDANVSLDERDRLIALAARDSRMHIDFSGLNQITGAGVRWLINYSRYIETQNITLEISGISQELRELSDAAGFRRIFEHSPDMRIKDLSQRPTHLPINLYPSHFHNGYAMRIGKPLPLGAHVVQRGINFSVYSRNATACTLVLFLRDEAQPMIEIPFPEAFRVGDIFTMMVFDLDYETIEYCFRMQGPSIPQEGHRFDATKLLLDPMARSINGGSWGLPRDGSAPFRAHIIHEDFDWESVAPPGLRAEDLVIYEMHVRDFTAHSSSSVKHPGTFAGMREKIPYLKELGVNCVELLPIFEFDELELDRRHPQTGRMLLNHWGYNTIAFFAPKAGYAATGHAGMQSDEVKALVKELHRNGIEVMLDVVFNHTAEGNENGPTLSFRGLDNSVYYLLDTHGNYYNYSGCGNTLNCNHPVVRDFVVECLRYWVSEYHIDGFRFDLASILGRDQNGVPLSNPPLLEALAADPILGRTKLVAEAWDAAGLYQVGSFPAYGRWMEWNGRYRDCARRFLKSDAGQVGELATRLLGSPDLYHSRGPSTSINFITCHDGFTLADMVSYNGKHNEANGEDSRDGSNDNLSWNCGIEGPTEQEDVNRLRIQQTKNALATLLLSQGVPMILMGDECGRTQHGNNNAYCHDGDLVWFDWNQLNTNAEIFRFSKLMIAFRKSHAILRHPHFPAESGNVFWHGSYPGAPDWSAESRSIAFMRKENDQKWIYVAMNMHWDGKSFTLPAPPHNLRWHVAINTAMSSPEDIFELGQEPALEDQNQFWMGQRSTVVLVAR